MRFPLTHSVFHVPKSLNAHVRNVRLARRTAHRTPLRLALVLALASSAAPIAASPAHAVVGGSSALGNTAVVRLVNGSSVCSGALWTSRIVVTAAHCVVDSSGSVTSAPISVYAPGVNILQSPQTVTQSSVITVDGWQKRGDFSQADDIAFVILASELAGASISRLATTDEISAWRREGRIVTFLGYGRTSPSGSSSAVPNLISQPLSALPTWPGGFTATQTATTGICSGDSGGPVITQVANQVVLIGVNSAASGPCSPSTQPSMTGFTPAAYPDLVRRALELTNVTALPTITTGSALGITTTSAYLNATAVGNNLLTTTSFTYGVQPDLSGASITVDAAQVTGATATSIEVAIANLMPGTKYYFRANATNLAGTVSGAIAQFTTLGGIPTVLSGTASSVGSDSAVLSGTVNANTVASQAFFQYSRAADFSTLDGTITAGDVVGSETATLTANLSRLEPGATYYWRIAATNAAGTTVGDTRTFTTPVFKARSSRTTTALINALLIDRSGITKTVVVPAARSRLQCAVNSTTKRLTFTRSGTCRVKITITRAGVTTSGNYNLAIR